MIVLDWNTFRIYIITYVGCIGICIYNIIICCDMYYFYNQIFVYTVFVICKSIYKLMLLAIEIFKLIKLWVNFRFFLNDTTVQWKLNKGCLTKSSQNEVFCWRFNLKIWGSMADTSWIYVIFWKRFTPQYITTLKNKSVFYNLIVFEVNYPFVFFS